MSTLTSLPDVGLRSVLLATDFSDVSQSALWHAIAIARHYGAKFCIAHVIPWLPMAMVGPDAAAANEEAVWRDAEHLRANLVESGTLDGLQHQFIVCKGEVWQELDAVITQEQVDLVVIGTSGRRGVEKLVLGSVAEKIFRHADCPVLTVGPSSYPDVRVEKDSADRVFLFATDFGQASFHALSYAASYANQFAAKLALLYVVTAVPASEGSRWRKSNDVTQIRESARTASLQHLQELTRPLRLEVRPEFVVDFGIAVPVSDKILEAAEKLRADLIFMGLHRSKYVGTASHMPSASKRTACPACDYGTTAGVRLRRLGVERLR
jgi:nucleotide-binding universal stress UspA family protein